MRQLRFVQTTVHSFTRMRQEANLVIVKLILRDQGRTLSPAVCVMKANMSNQCSIDHSANAIWSCTRKPARAAASSLLKSAGGGVPKEAGHRKEVSSLFETAIKEAMMS